MAHRSRLAAPGRCNTSQGKFELYLSEYLFKNCSYSFLLYLLCLIHFFVQLFLMDLTIHKKSSHNYLHLTCSSKYTAMDRREFLMAKKPSQKKVLLHQPVIGSRVLSGINPYSGPWQTNEIIHLLKRTMFGAKKSDVDFFAARSMSQTVDYLLNVSVAQTQPAPPVKNYPDSVTPTDPDTAIAAGNTWVDMNTNDGAVNSGRVNSFKSWWFGLMVNQERNILEKLTLFWHNHFATETNDIGRAIWCYQNNIVLRKNALGNFKQFVKEVTLDTGMLRYLNGYLNTNTAPDENYARELQELFTVGKGADNASPPYTEADVMAAAKVLTGWQVNGTTNTFLFTAGKHDTSNKQFSTFFNNTIITGRTGATGGDTELNDLLSMIFATNEVAINICRKLYRWFVYYEIDAATEQNVIVPLAQIFRSNNYNIKPVLSALLKSEHFFDAANQGCVIKSPADVVVGLCREFAVQFPLVTDYVNSYYMWLWLRGISLNLQQNIGDPPSVAGWSAYYQAPQFHEIWINSDTLPKRNQYCDLMITTGYTRNGKNIKIDVTLLASSLSNPGDPNVLINDIVGFLFRIPISQTSKDQLKKDILLSGQTNDSYWTNAWSAYIANPGNMTNANIVKTRLQSLFQYLMRLSEYQLC